MKIFVSGFSSMEQVEIIEGLIEKGIEVLYWIKKKPEYVLLENDIKKFPKTIFHVSFDALSAEPALGIDTGTLECPGIEIFNFLQKRETQIFQIMDQLEFSHINFVEKKRIYHRCVSYWYGVLKKFSPSAILFADIPHIPYNLVLYSVAKFLGIKILIYKRAKGVPDRVLFFDDFENYHILRDEYKKQLQNGVNFGDLSIEFQEYYTEQNNFEKEKKMKFRKEIYTFIPDKIKAVKILPSVDKIFQNIFNFRFLKVFKSFIWMLFHKTRVLTLKKMYVPYWKLNLEKQRHVRENNILQKEYSRFEKNIDWDKKFIYVPLHLQPECSTNPQGGVFDDQLLMLEMLSKSIPNDWMIYVKENPLQWYYHRGFFGRYRGFYKELSDFKNVNIISSDISTFELIRKSIAVATVTGTVGWEAIVRGKFALIFGIPWYVDCEGVFSIQNIFDCKKAFLKIQENIVPDQNKIFAFLKSIEKVGIQGYSNKKFKKFSLISQEENKINFVEAFYSELKK